MSADRLSQIPSVMSIAPMHPYGTQYRLGPDGPQLQRVSDPVGDLDARRAAVGLPPAGLALEKLRDRLAAAPCLGTAAPAVLVDAA
ncbi:hypothetical protein AB0C52_24570 [Streptomyces sp. NPDC048717]|uniref:hypothetical protein n=1 Tax=Streptomyces sp. NPDC048717 TaxID=3154928 RepID=UPI00341FE6A8